MAFQSNSFQSSAFQMAHGATPPAESIDGDAYREYHKRLKRMVQISEERDKKKYIEIVQGKIVPVENPLVVAAMESVVAAIAQPEIDFSLVQRNAEIALRRVEAVLAYYERAAQIARRRKQDDEIIILLSIL